jgi:hypothetical protein
MVPAQDEDAAVIRQPSRAYSSGALRRDLAGASAEAGRTAHWGAVIRVTLTTMAVLVIGGSTSVFACPMCFGAEETSMIDGTKLGIMVMLGITFVVQGGFVGFFFYLRQRAKRIAESELDTEWAELQRASRTS